MNDHAVEPRPSPLLARALRQLTRARDAFYEKQYAETVERCQEVLALFLPAPDAVPPTPEEQGDLFLRTWGAHIPLLEAERIAGVFTFFVRRKAQFRYERGRPLPRKEWWQLLQITREEAAEVLGASQRAVEAVRQGLHAGTPSP
jgi:HEPN domain-containing protein